MKKKERKNHFSVLFVLPVKFGAKAYSSVKKCGRNVEITNDC